MAANQSIAFRKFNDMKRTLGLLFLLPFFVRAQEGVHFEKDLTWQQVKEKAKTENKYIFIDCFATWCGPCKMMDENVYPKDSVGEVLNKKFISVRVQFDTAKADDAHVKEWYADAHKMNAEYAINAYPTFLFLTPAGKLVHRAIGYQSPSEFVSLAVKAIDPTMQYYTLLEEYRKGKRDYAAMPALAAGARRFGQKELSLSIAGDYMHNYLEKLPDNAFGTGENLEFISRYCLENISSKDRIADWYFRRPQLVDSVMHRKGYAVNIANYIVYKEVLTPSLLQAKTDKKEPDWSSLEQMIIQKFGPSYVDGNLMVAKINYYKSVEDWKDYTRWLVRKSETDSLEKLPRAWISSLTLNNLAWDIFQHSNDKSELEKALYWSDLALKIWEPGGGAMDTKANILYRLGRKDEALELEARAAALLPKDEGIQQAYKDMQEGKPTWKQ